MFAFFSDEMRCNSFLFWWYEMDVIAEDQKRTDGLSPEILNTLQTRWRESLKWRRKKRMKLGFYSNLFTSPLGGGPLPYVLWMDVNILMARHQYCLIKETRDSARKFTLVNKTTREAWVTINQAHIDKNRKRDRERLLRGDEYKASNEPDISTIAWSFCRGQTWKASEEGKVCWPWYWWHSCPSTPTTPISSPSPLTSTCTNRPFAPIAPTHPSPFPILPFLINCPPKQINTELIAKRCLILVKSGRTSGQKGWKKKQEAIWGEARRSALRRN